MLFHNTLWIFFFKTLLWNSFTWTES